MELLLNIKACGSAQPHSEAFLPVKWKTLCLHFCTPAPYPWKWLLLPSVVAGHLLVWESTTAQPIQPPSFLVFSWVFLFFIKLMPTHTGRILTQINPSHELSLKKKKKKKEKAWQIAIVFFETVLNIERHQSNCTAVYFRSLLVSKRINHRHFSLI